MPPKGSKVIRNNEREPSIEHTPEYDEFIEKLKAFHEKRGTSDVFEATPKISIHHVNLKTLYDRVVEEGGYDLVSDTKAKPLMWRKLAEEQIGKSPHLAAQAFQVKSAYYKNLSAYEIVEHWKEDAPPREILEDLTAKGTGVRGRTLESFERPGNRETDKLANGGSDSEEDDGTTPKQEKDKMDVDEPELTTGRSSRGLRQAPPQRVLFQSDVAPARQSRTAGQAASPAPASGVVNSISQPSYFSNSANTTLANYEPRQQYPLSLKPVVTPANNPDYYRRKRKLQQDASISQVAKRFKGIMLPGTGFIGPNIYVRAQLALQSGLEEEERYALHHLVKISHERGDKYRFDQFAGLAEALIDKVLQISSLFHDVDWTITYSDDESKLSQTEVLDGLNGTPDVLHKLSACLPLDNDDDVQEATFTQRLEKIVEAGLIIRNMVMLEENAQYVSRLPLLKDYLCIVLNIQHPALVELQHYALETAEQVSLYYHIDCKDPLYQTLLAQIKGTDRGRIVTALRSVSRLGMRYMENKRLDDVPVSLLENICEWLMVEDEELRSACLDFLFQYTSTADNVPLLIKNVEVRALMKQLSRLLLSGAREDSRKDRRATKNEPELQPTQVPRLAKELIEQLLKHEEPERSSHWLRMCFQDDPNAEMTQIDLWKSYQGTFMAYQSSHRSLIAGDFIKNVSNTFAGASAQVAGQNKYVIRGIKPRVVPVDYRGRELIRCQWRSSGAPNETEQQPAVFAYSDGHECGQFFPNSASVFEHILLHHLQIPRKKRTPIEEAAQRPTPSLAKSLNTFDFAAASPLQSHICAWSTCKHTTAHDIASKDWVRRAFLARHIETHLPDSESSLGQRQKQKQSSDENNTSSAKAGSKWVWLNTLIDERTEAAGVPLGACLVMRNIARGINKMAPESSAQAEALERTRADAILDEHHADGDAAVATAAATDDHHTGDDKAESGEGGGSSSSRQNQAAGSGKAIVMQRLFDPVKDRILFAMAYNYVLKDSIGALLKVVAQGGGG